MAFEQHPVPQHISSYQFRLVGDMTLKQFFELAGGGVVALIFYASPFPAIIRWPLVIFSAIFGGALAFLPIQDRPLEQWVIAFIRSIYSPTEFYWKRYETRPVYFSEQSAAPLPQTNDAVQSEAEAPKNKISEGLEVAEAKFLSGLSGIIPSGDKPAAVTIVQPAVQATPTPSPRPEVGRAEVQIPTIESPVIEKHTEPVGNIYPQAASTAPIASGLSPMAGSKLQTQQAQFSNAASPPSPPTATNVVVGQVVDSQGGIVEGAILEIRDGDGRPVRAMKTNKAGHFMIVTPLVNGVYSVIIEKEGASFEPVSFEANGALIQPIIIRANGSQNTQNINK